ncbi:hypothetical protein PVAND_010419 [Polypedilum vanderplanki]|uniref:Ankyrin-2 n=1 Tax=Polypedilum vanderplanki TaxID=319348 RepID=A0A9J6CGJ4_POLVA|nr:hypothetical protein PVAND_010419 [Polypedilum vanderplanki]
MSETSTQQKRQLEKERQVRQAKLQNEDESDSNTSFLRAARAGNLEKVLEHLKNNIDINTCNANGLNALHLASKDGHISVVSELLSRGALVDAATKKGNTALHIASLAGQEEVVKLLIQHNASVNVQSQNGFTPLYMAAQENHDSVVKLLLANGANQSLATEDGFTPLAVAMQQGHDKVVAVLLESDTRGKVRLPALHIAAKKDDVKAATLLLENDHNPDVTSKSGFTPLHIASHYGNEGIANLLIQKGADVNYAAKHSITPLHVAAKWGKTNMVALLLEKGANIESKTRDGLTPLHCAARSGHEQVVDLLLERGAPISSKTKNGLAALHMAAQGEHVDAARILLYHRAPVDEVTVDYLTALHVAAHCGHVRVAKLLLDRNADANARALNGFTPLHIACKKNRIKVVELLLKHGASIGATTESGLTPLHVASFMGCMNIVIYLLQHEASPDVPTVRGETPLHLAARANQTDIIRILLRNGAQVDARAREQQTPLHIASRLGNVDIVMLLLQHGAQVDAVTKDMYTALHIAAKEGQDEVAAVLLENGAQIDATTKKGFTPLHLTAKYGNIKVAQLLLSKDAPVDAQGKNGVTPLHVASHYDHQNVALLLLEKGASPHATAKNGHTPLHIAARKNQMDIATTLLEYGAQANAESKAGFTPLHLSAQEGHTDMSSLLLEHKADADHQARNGLTALHLCAQEDKVQVAQILVKHGANIEAQTKANYTPLHVASHFGQVNMVRYLIEQGAQPNVATGIGYTPLHQAAQQGHLHIVQVLVENKADPNITTSNGQTALHIAQKLGYISVFDSLKPVTDTEAAMSTSITDEKYRVVAPEAMHETFMSDSEEEGEDTALSDQPYRYLTVDEMKSLGDDSLPIDVTRDERIDNKMVTSTESAKPPQALEDSISPQHISVMDQSAVSERTVTDYAANADNIVIDRHPQHVGFLVSFLVDARGGAMRGCRHSGVRIIVPARSAAQPTRITCRYVKPQRTMHPPPLMEGEALASRVLELGPVGAKFLGPVIMEVPHFASLRGKEREIVILRSDNGETWREHTIENSDEIISEVLNDCLEPEDIAQMDELGGGRICRFVTYDFPQYFAVISRIHQEVHAIGPEGGMVSSTVVPQVQAVFPQGALTKKIKVGLQAQPIDPDLTAKLLGRGVAVSPVVTVEPRRRKFHKAITLSIPTPRAHSQGMINQYSGNAPTLRLLCSITGGTTRAQWEDVTGSTPLTFVNDCVSFTTTVSARFWLMDCRNIADATKMATELYKEAIHVPFMAKFVVFAKRVDPMEARLRVFCMTDDREDKTLEQQENFTEVAKSRDVEVLENKIQYLELAGNLIPVTKSGDQLQFPFKAFRENRLPFSVRVKDQHADTVGRALFMREPKVAKGEQPQSPICILNIVLPEDIIPEQISILDSSQEVISRLELSSHLRKYPEEYSRLSTDLRMSDVSNFLGDDWIRLAPEIGVNEQEVENIIEDYPNSTAQQAQAMLRLFQSKKQNDLNILENGLRAIGRDDIVERCLIRTTTTTVTKRHPKRTSDTNGYEEGDLIKDSESLEDLNKKRYARYEHDESKYSAEEKAVESDEDEAVKRSVAERREKIQKRLSGEQKFVPSTQQKEIVEEIITIKRQSLIEDKVAQHEDEIIMQKPVDNTYKSAAVPEQVMKLKTTTHHSTAVDKHEFEKELQDKFSKTLGDVEKFEHKYTHEAIPTTQDFLASEIQQSSVLRDLPEKTVTTVTKTTTMTESSDHDTNGRQESPVVKKREVITTTTTYTNEDGVTKQTKTQEVYSDDDFERIERDVMDPSVVDDILEEARQKADSLQSTVTTTKTTVHPGETKETITTTTTIRTIESINLDDVSDEHRQYSDDEEVIQKKSVESVHKTSTPPPTPHDFDGRSGEVQQLPDDAAKRPSVEKIDKKYLAAAEEDFEEEIEENDDVEEEEEQTQEKIKVSKVRTQQSQSQTFTETKTTATSKKDINLRLETLQKTTQDKSKIPKIDESPLTDSDYVESPDSSFKSSRKDSPKVKLLIGRKEIKTNETSAITESTLTVYGTQDVDIKISSESSISVTTTQEKEKETIGDLKDTPRKYKRYTIIEDDVLNEEDDFNRADRKREDSVAFATKKSIHLYGSFDSNADSPATDSPASHYVTDTGISLTRGFTETTSPGLESHSEKDPKKPIVDTLDVETEEMELTDAGLSPIQADDADMLNQAFQLASEEETHYINTATSPVEFEETSEKHDTSEAATITDKIETKDASSSPLEENVALSVSEMPEITDEEFLTTRRLTNEVKTKVKIIEEQSSKIPTIKRRVDFEEPPKIDEYLNEKSETKPLSEIKKKFSPEKEIDDEPSISSEPTPPVHEVIQKIEKQISVEGGKKIPQPESGISHRYISKDEKLTSEDTLDDVESQIVQEEDMRPIVKKVEKRNIVSGFKADPYYIDSENLEGIHEPVFEKKITKKHVSDLTDETCIEEPQIPKVSESIAAIESKLKEVRGDLESTKTKSQQNEENKMQLDKTFDILSPSDSEKIDKTVAEKVSIIEKRLSDEEEIKDTVRDLVKTTTTVVTSKVIKHTYTKEVEKDNKLLDFETHSTESKMELSPRIDISPEKAKESFDTMVQLKQITHEEIIIMPKNPNETAKEPKEKEHFTEKVPAETKIIKAKSRTPSPSKDDKILPNLKEEFRPSAPEIQEIDSLKTITQREFVTGFTKQEKVIHEVTTVIKEHVEKSLFDEPKKENHCLYDKILPSDDTKHVEPEKLLTKDESSKPKDLKEKSRTPSPSKDDKILPSDDTKHVEPEKLLTKDESSKPKDLKEKSRTPSPSKDDKILPSDDTKHVEPEKLLTKDESSKPKDLKRKITYSIIF